MYSTFSKTKTPNSTMLPPGVLLREAAIGKLGGVPHTLLGALANANGGENAIIYGLATDAEIAAVESKIGSTISQAIARGAWVQISIGTFFTGVRDQIQRLVGIAPMPAYEVTWTPDRKKPFSESWGIDSDGFEAHRQRESLRQAGAAEQEDRLRAAYAEAMKLRLPAWSVDQMAHRAAWPAFFPAWARELIRDHSRSWLELPNPPEERKPVVAPVPAEAQAAPSDAPIPHGAAGKTFFNKWRAALA